MPPTPQSFSNAPSALLLELPILFFFLLLLLLPPVRTSYPSPASHTVTQTAVYCICQCWVTSDFALIPILWSWGWAPRCSYWARPSFTKLNWTPVHTSKKKSFQSATPPPRADCCIFNFFSPQGCPWHSFGEDFLLIKSFTIWDNSSFVIFPGFCNGSLGS